MIKIISWLLVRDFKIFYRKRSEWLISLVFFMIVVIVFPVAFAQRTELITAAAPGILWLAAMLAVILSLEHTFKADWQLGVFDVLVLSPYPLPLLLFVRLLVLWLIIGLPIVIGGPLLAIFLGLSFPVSCAVAKTFLLGTPILCLVGGLGAALTVTMPRGGLLMAILMLPLYIPVLIFGVSGISHAAVGLLYQGQLALLGALLILCLIGVPFGIAAAIRISVA